jgi:hypothetical protein
MAGARATEPVSRRRRLSTLAEVLTGEIRRPGVLSVATWERARPKALYGPVARRSRRTGPGSPARPGSTVVPRPAVPAPSSRRRLVRALVTPAA